LDIKFYEQQAYHSTFVYITYFTSNFPETPSKFHTVSYSIQQCVSYTPLSFIQYVSFIHLYTVSFVQILITFSSKTCCYQPLTEKLIIKICKKMSIFSKYSNAQTFFDLFYSII